MTPCPDCSSLFTSPERFHDDPDGFQDFRELGNMITSAEEGQCPLCKVLVNTLETSLKEMIGFTSMQEYRTKYVEFEISLSRFPGNENQYDDPCYPFEYICFKGELVGYPDSLSRLFLLPSAEPSK